VIAPEISLIPEVRLSGKMLQQEYLPELVADSTNRFQLLSKHCKAAALDPQQLIFRASLEDLDFLMA